MKISFLNNFGSRFGLSLTAIAVLNNMSALACSGPGATLNFGKLPVIAGAKAVRIQRINANVPSKNVLQVYKTDTKPLNTLSIEIPDGHIERYAFTKDPEGNKIFCNFDDTGANQCFHLDGSISPKSSALTTNPTEPAWISASKKIGGEIAYHYAFGSPSSSNLKSDFREIDKNRVSMLIHLDDSSKKQLELTYDYSKNELIIQSVIEGNPTYSFTNQFTPNKEESSAIERNFDMSKSGGGGRTECLFYKEKSSALETDGERSENASDSGL